MPHSGRREARCARLDLSGSRQLRDQRSVGRRELELSEFATRDPPHSLTELRARFTL
jgi:hypothetical protein